MSELKLLQEKTARTANVDLEKELGKTIDKMYKRKFST